MKTGKLIVLMVSALLLGLYSCETDEDNGTDGDDCKVTKVSFDIPNDPARGDTYFNYDNDGRLTEVRSEDYDLGSLPYKTRIAISYNGDKLSEVNTYSTFENDPEERDHKFEFFYDGDKVDSITQLGYNAFVGADLYYLISYDNNKIEAITRYTYNNVDRDYVYSSSSELSWDGNNVSVIRFVANDGYEQFTEYTYDDKKSALNGLVLAFANTDLSLLSSNNVIKSILKNSDGTVLNEDIFTYTYNEDDYPETVTQGQFYPLYEFEYNCN